MAAPEPTAEELRDLSLACSKVWELDNNRLQPGTDYTINLQVSTHREGAAGKSPRG